MNLGQLPDLQRMREECANPRLKRYYDEAIRQTLERTNGNVKRTAEILNINRPKLYRRMKKFKLQNQCEDEVVDVARDG